MQKKPKRQPSRVTERFSLIPIFSKLRGEETGRILRICEEETYEAGKTIFEPGDPSERGFFIILEGKVEIHRPDPDGGEPTIVASLSDRSVFGEMSFLARRARSARAIAVAKTRVNRVPGDTFRDLLDEGDVAAYKVIYNFAVLTGQRLRRMEQEMMALVEQLEPESRETKLKELQEFRNTLFQEWSF